MSNLQSNECEYSVFVLHDTQHTALLLAYHSLAQSEAETKVYHTSSRNSSGSIRYTNGFSGTWTIGASCHRACQIVWSRICLTGGGRLPLSETQPEQTPQTEAGGELVDQQSYLERRRTSSRVRVSTERSTTECEASSLPSLMFVEEGRIRG